MSGVANQYPSDWTLVPGTGVMNFSQAPSLDATYTIAFAQSGDMSVALSGPEKSSAIKEPSLSEVWLD
jgi:hypothetical protein